MKTLTNFIKESLNTINEKNNDFEAETVVDILTLGNNDRDTESHDFVEALYKEAEKFCKYNYAWNSATFYFFTNKSKLTKEIEKTLKSCECVTPEYEAKFKYRKRDNVTGDDMKKGISDEYGGIDFDKIEVYKDDFGTIYNYGSGFIYTNSKYGEMCIYPKE